MKLVGWTHVTHDLIFNAGQFVGYIGIELGHVVVQDICF